MNSAHYRWLWLMLGLTVALALTFAVACGGGGDNGGPAPDEQASQDQTSDEDGSDAVAAEDEIGQTISSTMATIDFIDQAGFHDMAEDLAEATEINPRYADTVGNVLAATLVADWPEDAHEAVDAFAADIEALKTALEAEDLEGARAASEAVHDTQHDLSEGAYAWLAQQSGKLVSASPSTVALASMAAIDIVDSAGFHDMAEELAEATEMNPRNAGKVGNVLAAARAAGWPTGIQAELDRFIADAEALKAALDAEDLDAARAASEAIHESQHDLSEATYAWLGGQPTMAHDSDSMVATCNLKVQDIIDSAAFHDMAEELAEASEVNPRYAGKVGNVLTAINVAAWNEDVSAELAAVVADLEALKAALDAEDLEGAHAASEAVHDSQHDLSHATFAWVGNMAGMMDSH